MKVKILNEREQVEIQIRATLFKIRPNPKMLAHFLHTTEETAENMLSGSMSNIRLKVLKKWLIQLKKVNY